MTAKKVAFGRPKSQTMDEWVTTPHSQESAGLSAVSAPTAPAEPMKRLTIDVSRSLHSRIKATCALKGTKMADEIRLLLEREFSKA
jgi:hypothetical protein